MKKEFKQLWIIKMSIKETFLINLISGPSAGKTTACALLFAKLKILGYRVEYVQEVAKGLVWAEDYETLDNQYWVTQQQFKALNSLQEKVDFIITDGCLLHGIYYNQTNKNNVSDLEKTEEYIWSCFDKFNNINIFLERGDFPYEQAGRQQTEEESKEIDKYFLKMLKEKGLRFEKHMVNKKGNDYCVSSMIEYILKCVEKIN